MNIEANMPSNAVMIHSTQTDAIGLCTLHSWQGNALKKKNAKVCFDTATTSINDSVLVCPRICR